MMKKSQRWNNYSVVEYPVVNVRGVSNIWNGALTETDDSEYEDPDERAIRLNVENDNYDLSEGMTPKIYTPPLRKNRRKKKEPEIEESISDTSDRGFQTDKEPPNLEPTVQPRTVADEDIPTVSDKKDDRGRLRRTGSDTNTSSDEESNLFDRPVTESAGILMSQ